jgi:hypothetical protein
MPVTILAPTFISLRSGKVLRRSASLAAVQDHMRLKRCSLLSIRAETKLTGKHRSWTLTFRFSDNTVGNTTTAEYEGAARELARIVDRRQDKVPDVFGSVYFSSAFANALNELNPPPGDDEDADLFTQQSGEKS